MKTLIKINLLKKLLNKLSRVLYLITPREFKDCLQYRLDNQKIEEIWEVFSSDLKRSLRFTDSKSIRNYAINLALENEINSDEDFYYLEFGVYEGISANLFSKFVKKLYAFDSFLGISEEWKGVAPKGWLDMGGKLPKLNKNIIPVVGYVEDTLDEFLKKHNPKVNFIHFDMDVYSPTKFSLLKIKPYLNKGCVIIFDELYNYINWKEGEYKALVESFESTEFQYKAFNINAGQVVIQVN